MSGPTWIEEAGHIVGAAFGLGDELALGMRGILAQLQADPVKGRVLVGAMLRRIGAELASGERSAEFTCNLLGLMVGMIQAIQEAGG